MTIVSTPCSLSLTLTLISSTLAETTTTSATTTTTAWIDQEYPKAVISFAVLGFALIVGLGTAKLADWCYERESIRDDASDISENTKELLKAQLTLMGFRKKKDDKNPVIDKEKHRKFFNTWATKVRLRRQKEKAAAEAAGEGKPKTGPTSPRKGATVSPAEAPPTPGNNKPPEGDSPTRSSAKFNEAVQQWEGVDEMVPTVESSSSSSISKQSTAKSEKTSMLMPVNSPTAAEVKSLSSTDFDFIDESFKTLDTKSGGKNKTGKKANSGPGSPNKIAPISPVDTDAVALERLKTTTPNPNIQNKTQFSRYVREPTTVSLGNKSVTSKSRAQSAKNTSPVKR